MNAPHSSGRTATIKRAALSTLLVCVFGFGSFALVDGANADAPTPATVEQPTSPGEGAPAGDASIPAAAASATPALADGGPMPVEKPKKHQKTFVEWVETFLPIVIILVVIGFVLIRLPKVDVGHSKAYRRRRVLNWLPLGLTYAFLYMGRYNLTVAKGSLGDLMPIADFAMIFAVGAITYGVAFVINGPLTDRIGGKKAIIIGAVGSLLANAAMGIVTLLAMSDASTARAAGETVTDLGLTPAFMLLYAVNMYFQSFGAVAIVKVNAPWFHVRERGVFGAIFGILISLGIYFAYDWSAIIVSVAPVAWVFFVPAAILTIFVILDIIFVENSPAEAGLVDFDTGDASSGDDGPRLPVKQVFIKMLSNPIILTIAFIEFCSGYLRQAIMQYYKPYAISIANPDSQITWVNANWGVLLCAAGILGGTIAGVISDRVFGSRRGPVAAFLYGFMLAGAIAGVFLIDTAWFGWLVVVMSLLIIGVHGMLSGTASMDFGGRKNTGVAVGIIDGFVYLGTGAMSVLFSFILPSGEIDPTTGARFDADPSNWVVIPISMIPMALIGFWLSRRIWHAKPQPKGAPAGH